MGEMYATSDDINFEECITCPKCAFVGKTTYEWEYWQKFFEEFKACMTVFNDLILRTYKCPKCNTIHVTRSRVLIDLQGKVLE